MWRDPVQVARAECVNRIVAQLTPEENPSTKLKVEGSRATHLEGMTLEKVSSLMESEVPSAQRALSPETGHGRKPEDVRMVHQIAGRWKMNCHPIEAKVVSSDGNMVAMFGGRIERMANEKL